MLLSDIDIRAAIASGDISTMPGIADRDIQPASIDLYLGNILRVLTRQEGSWLNVKLPVERQFETVALDDDAPFTLEPGDLVLGCTREHITLSERLAAQLSGKSSLGRLGLAVHVTAGWVDPRWSGQLTVELLNATRVPIVIYTGMPVAQISFQWLMTPASRGYAGKYQHARGVHVSRMDENFREPVA